MTTSSEFPDTGRSGLLPTTPPADAVLPPRSARAPAPGTSIPCHYSMCFCCGDEHPSGLYLRLVAGEGLSLSGTFTVTELHQGAPGLAHGGLLTAAFDDALGCLNWMVGGRAVTARLETDFRRPVPVGSVLHIEAEVLGVKGRKIFTRAIGRLDAPNGPIAITAKAMFIKVPLEHFIDNGRPEDIERARGDSAVRNSLANFEVNP